MEFREQRAIYLQIADMICEKILQQEWHAKEKIPSIRELAIEVEVNPNTVVKTYSYLEDQGIIFKQRGIGYFVIPDGYNKVLQLKKEKFLQHEVPKFFKTMRLLGVDFESLTQIGENNENE